MAATPEAGGAKIAEPNPDLDRDFVFAAKTFANPEQLLSADSQLAFMTDLWSHIGYEVPDLSSKDAYELHTRLKASETPSRVIPTPLLPVTERTGELPKLRTKILQTADRLSATVMPALAEEPLVMPTNGAFNELMRAPTTRYLRFGGSRFAQLLRYKTAEGELVDRAGLIDDLEARGHIRTDSNGTPWTFPIVREIGPTSPRAENRETVGELFEQVGAMVLPETLLVQRAVHQAAGLRRRKQTDRGIDLVNEVVGRLDRIRRVTSLQSIAGVRWSQNPNALAILSDWDVQRYRDFNGTRKRLEAGLPVFGVRHAISGIGDLPKAA